MNEGQALVEELKRLTLENAQLKAAIVAMDEEREVHPMPVDGNHFLKLNPVVVEVEVDEYDLNLNREHLWEKGAAAIARELMQKNWSERSQWGGFMNMGVRNSRPGKLLFRMSMFVGVVNGK